jgi:hypothetical protein
VHDPAWLSGSISRKVHAASTTLLYTPEGHQWLGNNSSCRYHLWD